MTFCVAYRKWGKDNPKQVKKMSAPPPRSTFSFKKKTNADPLAARKSAPVLEENK